MCSVVKYQLEMAFEFLNKKIIHIVIKLFNVRELSKCVSLNSEIVCIGAFHKVFYALLFKRKTADGANLK